MRHVVGDPLIVKSVNYSTMAHLDGSEPTC